MHCLGVTVKVNMLRKLGARDQPRVAHAQPLLGTLDLSAAANDLIKDAKLIANSVAVAGQVQRRHAVQVASGQAAKTAVAKSGIALLLQQITQVIAQLAHDLLGGVVQPHVVQVVGQRAPQQKLC